MPGRGPGRRLKYAPLADYADRLTTDYTDGTDEMLGKSRLAGNHRRHPWSIHLCHRRFFDRLSAAPGDEAKLVVLSEVRVSRDDAHADAVGAALAGGDCAGKAERSLADLLHLLQVDRGGIGDLAVGDASDDRLDADEFRRDRAEGHADAHLDGIADGDVGAVAGADGHVGQVHMGPVAADVVLPPREFDGFRALVRRQCRVRGGGGVVEALGVFAHHAVSVENGHDGADGFPHQVDPRERQAAIGLGVVEREDLRLEHVEEAVHVHFILELGLRRCRTSSS